MTLHSFVSDEVFWVILMVVIRDKLSEDPAAVTDHAVTALALRMFTGVRYTPSLKARRPLEFVGCFGEMNFSQT